MCPHLLHILWYPFGFCDWICFTHINPVANVHKKGSEYLRIVFLWAIVDSNFWICKSLNSKFETITYEPGPIHHTALPSYAMAYPIQHVQLHRTLSLSTAPPIWQTPHSIDDSSNSSPMWHERCDVTCTPTSSPVWHGCIVCTSILYLQSSACS